MKKRLQLIRNFGYFCSLILLIVFFANYMFLLNSEQILEKETIFQTDSLYEVKLTLSDPIIIINDQDLESFGFQGSGTEAEPYLIENYLIDTDDEFGIFITNVSKHFKIQYCEVYAGISAISISNLTLENIEITNNVCQGEEWYGIYIYSTNYVVITDNWCSGGAAGIVCWYSNSEFIENNECYDTDFGIALYETHKSIIGDNFCYNNNIAGIRIMYSSYNNISRNTINIAGKGISLVSASFGSIHENFCNNTFWGISAEYTNRISIHDNLCIRSTTGIQLWHTGKINITHNECYSCHRGISVDDDSESQVRNNICYNNSEHGIYIRTGESTQVSNNSLYLNKLTGIKNLRGSPIIGLNNCSMNNIGILMRDVQSLTLSNNTCTLNVDGIVLEETDYSTISYNILQENIEYGVKIWDWSTWNKIHHNYFICNNRNGTEHGFSQAYDEGYNNRWYESSTDEGNYWNDYEGIGEYQIDGKDNNTDPYPFEYYFECIKTETITEPTEESSLSLLTVLLSFIGTASIAKIRYKKEKK